MPRNAASKITLKTAAYELSKITRVITPQTNRANFGGNFAFFSFGARCVRSNAQKLRVSLSLVP